MSRLENRVLPIHGENVQRAALRASRLLFATFAICAATVFPVKAQTNIPGGNVPYTMTGTGPYTVTGNRTASSIAIQASVPNTKLTVNSGVSVTGTNTAIYFPAASVPGSVITNRGTLTGQGSSTGGSHASILISESGTTVNNHGTIGGNSDAIYMSGVNTVNNDGLLTANSMRTAAYFHTGGTYVGGSTSSITGAGYGVIINAGSGTVTNAGSISVASNAVWFRGIGTGKTLLNQTSGSLVSTGSGNVYGVYVTGSSDVKITNHGTIGASSGTAVRFDTGDSNSLTLGTGSIINGDIVSTKDTGNSVILTGNGSEDSAISGFEKLTSTADSQWTLSGLVSMSSASSSAVQVNGNLTITGSIANNSGVSTVSSGGRLSIGDATHASASLSGKLTVESGASAGGYGKVTGNTQIDSGGTFAVGSALPGLSGGAAAVVNSGTFTNGGTISMNNSATGDSLTISGNYAGGGTVKLDTQLAGDGSPSDVLTITGTPSGTTAINITNVGGAGAATTGKGILVVNTPAGSPGNAFTLAGGSIVAGVFTYTLVHDTDGKWYLRSQSGVDLAFDKTANGSFALGQPASYTLTVTNNGTMATQSAATITDTLDASLTFVSAPGCTDSGQTVTCTVTAGLAAGASQAFTINVTPTVTGKVSNTAQLTGGDPDCTAAKPCTSNASETNVYVPKLSLLKKPVPDSFTAGAEAYYALTVTNDGGAATTAAAVVTDTISSNLTLGTLPDGCTATGQTVTCTIPTDFASGGVATFLIPVTPTAAAANTAVLNTATVSGGGDPGCPTASRCSSTVNTDIDAPQLSLSKQAVPSSFIVGIPGSYVLTVVNDGNIATTDIATVTDVIDANLAIGTLPSGCSASGRTVTCSIPAGLASGSTASFAIPVTPTNAGSITNTASVSGGGDPRCVAVGDCSSGGIPTSLNSASLTISKQSLKSGIVSDNVVIGDAIVYRLTVRNTGSAATTDVATVTDVVPASLTLGTLPTDCSVVSQTVTCTVAAGLAAGSQVTFDLPATVTRAGTFTNSVSITGGGDPNCAGTPADAKRCRGESNISVTEPRLTLSKVANPVSFTVGVEGSYLLTVTNNGAAATISTATVIDNVPASLTLGSLPSGCSAVGQQVTCIVAAALAANGGAQDFTIPVTPTATSTALFNTASVQGGGDMGCPSQARCRSTIATTVGAPQLLLSKTVGSLSQGVPGNYTLTVTNQGTATTPVAATVTDLVPASLLLGTMPSGCSNSGQLINCTVAAGLAVNDSAVFVISVTPQTGDSVNNSASIIGGGDGACPLAKRCGSSVETNVNAPQLAISKTVSPSPMVVNTNAVYTITVTNTGPLASTDIATVTDVIPAGLTVVSAPGCTTTVLQTVTCEIPAGLAANGGSRNFAVTVTPTASAISLTNTASVTGGGDSTCSAAGSCTASATAAVNTPKLSLNKTASTLAVGQSGSYTLTATNEGTAATTAVATIVDNVPTGLTITSVPSGCTAAFQAVTCSIQTGMIVGASQSFTIDVTPTVGTPGLINSASISGGGDPGCPAEARCSASVTSDVGSPSLTMTKTSSTTDMAVGHAASYTLTVTNNGTSSTVGTVSLSDTLPGQLIAGSPLPADCSASGQTVTCTIAVLAAGDSKSFVIPVMPIVAVSGLVNTASVTGGGTSCVNATDCVSSSGSVEVKRSRLGFVKSASPVDFVVGQPASYTLTATNSGDAATPSDLVITDTLDDSLAIGALPFGCSAVGQTVTCTISGGLAAGDSGSFVIPVTPTASVAGLTNIAQISGDNDPDCPSPAPCRSNSVVNNAVVIPPLSIPVDSRWALAIVALLLAGMGSLLYRNKVR